MIFPRFSAGLLSVALLVPPAAFGAAAPKSKAVDDSTSYKSAIVIDAATGNVLFERNADNISPPASMTKLMTFAVLHDRLASGALTLGTPVKIDVTDSKIGGTQVFLDPRETFSVEELIYAMMIQSANDAAHALARASAGSVEGFVELMNAKAQQLGMKNTTFRSPHGLPPGNRRVEDGDLTTPRDFALLSRHLIKNTPVLKYTAITARAFGEGSRPQPMQMTNHNKLVGKVAGVDGLKTGFTDAAGYCLSATAQRNGRRVILVIMGSLGPNGQRDLGRTRDQKAIELLEKGFAALPPPTAAELAAAAAAKKAAAEESPFTPAPAKSGGTPGAASSDTPSIKLALPKK